MALQIPQLPIIFRLLDILMIPLMFVLGGLRKDSLQETHPWHLWRHLTPETVDTSKAVRHIGTDKSFDHHFAFLFHAPIFGGWKKYIVLQPKGYDGPFRIGWVTYKNNKLSEIAVHKLIIKNSKIRVLSGTPNFSGYFFALTIKGEQIPLEKVGEGTLGDKRYPGVRLF